MAKPATKRVSVASSDVAVTPSVHAPSAVQTQSRAGQNAAAIGQALNLGAGILKIKGEADTAAGTLAAQKGEVDEETLRKQEKSAAWVTGAEKVIGRARAIEDEAAMQVWYAD